MAATQELKINGGLDPNSFKPLTLKESLPFNHNSRVFIFELDSPDAELNLPITSFILAKFIGPDGKDVTRPYTPIHQHEKGVLKLLIKRYDNSLMGTHVFNLKKGEKLEIKGPIPKLKYATNYKKRIGLLAGGTGLTPNLQVVTHILATNEDKTEVTLLFANITVEDILLKSEIDQLAQKHPNFKVHYILDKPPTNWDGLTGHVNDDVIRKYLPPPADDHAIYVCGPPGFMNAVSGSKAPDYSQGELAGALARVGFTKDHVFKF